MVKIKKLLKLVLVGVCILGLLFSSMVGLEHRNLNIRLHLLLWHNILVQNQHQQIVQLF